MITPVATRWISATAPNTATSSMGTPVRVVTWAEISTSWARTTAGEQPPGALTDVEKSHELARAGWR